MISDVDGEPVICHRECSRSFSTSRTEALLHQLANAIPSKMKLVRENGPVTCIGLNSLRRIPSYSAPGRLARKVVQ